MDPVGFVKWKMGVIDTARNHYEHCADQFQNGPISSSKCISLELKLNDDFSSWFNTTVLHVWILSKRLAYEGEQGKDLSQEISRHVWLDVEMKLHQAGVKTNISKIVRDLVSSYHGQCLGYDEGLYYGDALFAASLWRNLYGTANVSPVEIKEVLEYIRIQLSRLESTPFDNLMDGNFKFE